MLDRILKKLAAVFVEGFFGTVTLTVQNGKLCAMKVERTYKPEEV